MLASVPFNAGGKSLCSNHNKGFNQTQEICNVTTLDSLGCEVPNASFFKIDTEGSEVQVILGARETLAGNGHIIAIETDLPNENLTSLLTELGFNYYYGFYNPAKNEKSLLKKLIYLSLEKNNCWSAVDPDRQSSHRMLLVTKRPLVL